MLVSQKPQPIGNDQHVTPLTSNMKTGGVWFTFPQLAGGANVTFLNPSLDLSIAVERASPSPWQNGFAKKTKTKKLDGRKEVAEWKLLLQQQHMEGGVLVQKWGGKTDKSDAFKTERREIQSTAHSQPRRSGKEWVDYATKRVWFVNNNHYNQVNSRS